MGRKIVHSKEMQLRLTQLEYNDLSNEEFKKAIKRIYVEEYGEKLPAAIDVYSISDSDQLKNNDSGYRGTAIYFQSQKNDIDEVYVISQGTQNVNDWKYNLQALLVGDNIDQAKETYRFVNEAKNYFGTGASTSFTGLAHSLGHNNNATAHLLYGTFDDVYSVNGAQTNAYQLFNNDREFAESVFSEFSFVENDDIYRINPDKLEAFAKDYYKEKKSNIHQIISKDDPLYAVSGMRGFFTLGEIEMYDTNSNYQGLRNIMDGIPDDVVKDIQEIAIQYTKVTENGDRNDGIQFLTGIDLDLINKLDRNPIKAYTTQLKEIDQMACAMGEKLPEVLTPIKNIIANTDTFFQRFADAKYINSNQKKLIVNELSNIKNQLERMLYAVSFWGRIRAYSNSCSLIQMIIDFGMYISLIIRKVPAFKRSLNKLNRDDLRDKLHMILKGHSIQGVLKTISKSYKTYQGDDMLMTGTDGTSDVQVNVSDALRLYGKGKNMLKDEQDQIKKLQLLVKQEVADCYKQKVREIMNQIYANDANPALYSQLSSHCSFLDYKQIVSIHVFQECYSLKLANINDSIEHLHNSLEKVEQYFEDYRSSIEILFNKKANVTAMFDSIEGGID